TVSAVMLIFSVFIMSAVSYGYYFLPNEVSVLDNRFSDFNSVFKFSPVSKGSDKSSLKVDSNNLKESTARFSLFNIFPIKESKVNLTQRRYVVPSGKAFGIKLYTQGVIVVQTQSILSAGKKINPSQESGLRVGDVILKINSKQITQNSDVAEIFENSNGEKVEIEFERNSEQKTLYLQPVLSDEDGKYRAGIWVRDSSAGIGTMTYYDKTNSIFAGLGHPVCDIDTGDIMPLSSGKCVEAHIYNCYKGNKGTAGELCGSISDESIGDLKLNSNMGIYGIIDKINEEDEVIPVALNQEIKEGKAQIIATVNQQGPQYYDVEIKKIYSSINSNTKNMLIEVTDEKLIAQTGGIVQGMSGSPIIQNGMLVGAVTHVLINNPLQGYAIFAENMIKTEDSLNISIEKQAS
nr:SpoIVB peptidase [Clostridiales bacterium]